MKKQLIAMAVAAGMVAPMVAMAEATVYGRAHMSLDFNDDGNESAMNVSSNASRVGFKASMDLDNGMKAGAQMEGTVGVDTGGFSMNRNTFASLGGGFGEVRVGLHDTPLKDVRSKLDMFGDRVGDLRSLTRAGSVNLNAKSKGNAWDERFGNGILYISPKIADSWVIKAHYTTNKTTNPAQTDTNVPPDYEANDDTAYSVGANGMIGPIGLWLAYENYDYSGNRDSETAMRLGLSWKIAAFKINFMYHTQADNQVTDTNGVTGKYDRDVMSIGGAWKMGKNTFKLQYAMADDLSCSGTGLQTADCDKTAASTMGLGWDYSLAKGQTFYVMYAITANDDNAFYTVTGGGGHGDNLALRSDTAGASQDNSAFSVGYIVSF